MAVYQWGFNLEPLGSVETSFQGDILVGYPFSFIVVEEPEPPIVIPEVLYYEDYLRRYLADPLSVSVIFASSFPSGNITVENDLTVYLRKYLADPIN